MHVNGQLDLNALFHDVLKCVKTHVGGASMLQMQSIQQCGYFICDAGGSIEGGCGDKLTCQPRHLGCGRRFAGPCIICPRTLALPGA